MDHNHDWGKALNDHPIFSLPDAYKGPSAHPATTLELSTTTLPSFTQVDRTDNQLTPSGRRQVMVLKDAELIVAVGAEIRIAPLGEAKLSRSTRQTYKTLHTPNIQFEIHQISLNPSSKLLAVAGASQVAVVVLPRAGFSRLVPDTIDCKSVQVGQFYHASNASAPIAKIEWHPWGEAGSTLMVMTTDGKLREYDISVDTEEPQQMLSFIPNRRPNSFLAADSSEREVASFTLGKGRADWGPLTIYAVTKSGDVYSICPYLPQNTSIPSSYVHSLECFISAKQEFLAQDQGTSTATRKLSTIYDYQRKYITALLKQLPPGTVFPAISRSVLVHPPPTINALPTRQGPFLLQPSPRTLDGSEGGDATDISYLAFDTDEDESDGDGGETEHLGVIAIAFQDGKVDVCLDVEKVEARWDLKVQSRDLPMLAVYESIDLGLVTSLKGITVSAREFSPLDLLQANHPVFHPDPIHPDTIYVYHAFGVHSLNIGPVLQSLAIALRAEDDSSDTLLEMALQMATGTSVQPILSTFSVERKCSNPVIAVTIPNDVYLTYSIFILTSAMRISSFPLNIRSESPHATPSLPPATNKNTDQFSQQSFWLTPPDSTPAYVSLLKNNPYTPAQALSRTSGLPKIPQLCLPKSVQDSDWLTPDTLRYLGKVGSELMAQCNDIRLAVKAADERVVLQQEELIRMTQKCQHMLAIIENSKGPRHAASEKRFNHIQEEQKALLGRLDRMLQCLMERASPGISEHETKWFEELKRMKAEVMGVGKYDETSLVARIRLLEREYARLTPTLKELLEKEKKRKEKSFERNQGLGFSQAFEFGERSNLERLRISEVEKQILDLATKMEVSLSQTPSVK